MEKGGERLGEEGENERLVSSSRSLPPAALPRGYLPTTQARPSSIKEQGFFQRSQCPSVLDWLEKPRE